MPIIYDVDVVEPGKPVVRISCDARSTTMAVCGSQTNLFGELDAECQVKLPCALPPLGSSAEMHVATRRCGGVSNVGTGMSRY